MELYLHSWSEAWGRAKKILTHRKWFLILLFLLFAWLGFLCNPGLKYVGFQGILLFGWISICKVFLLFILLPLPRSSRLVSSCESFIKAREMFMKKITWVALVVIFVYYLFCCSGVWLGLLVLHFDVAKCLFWPICLLVLREVLM